MGTNFYLKKIIPMELKKKAHEVLDEILKDTYNFEPGFYEIQELIDNYRTCIHLGKRSCGWQFHWQKQPEYEDNLNSIKRFLKEELDKGNKIVDEYGEEFTLDQFINEEIGEAMYAHFDKENNRVYYNSDTYYKAHPEEKRYYYDPSFEWTSEDGLRFSDRDFS